MTEFWKFTGYETPIYINKSLKIADLSADTENFKGHGKTTRTVISVIVGESRIMYGVGETIEEVLKIISSDVPMQIEDRYKDYIAFRGSEGMIQLVPKCWEVHTLKDMPNCSIEITFYDPETTNYYFIGSHLPIEEVKRIVDWKGE